MASHASPFKPTADVNFPHIHLFDNIHSYKCSLILWPWNVGTFILYNYNKTDFPMTNVQLA